MTAVRFPIAAKFSSYMKELDYLQCSFQPNPNRVNGFFYKKGTPNQVEIIFHSGQPPKTRAAFIELAKKLEFGASHVENTFTIKINDTNKYEIIENFARNLRQDLVDATKAKQKTATAVVQKLFPARSESASPVTSKAVKKEHITELPLITKATAAVTPQKSSLLSNQLASRFRLIVKAAEPVEDSQQYKNSKQVQRYYR